MEKLRWAGSGQLGARAAVVTPSTHTLNQGLHTDAHAQAFADQG